MRHAKDVGCLSALTKGAFLPLACVAPEVHSIGAHTAEGILRQTPINHEHLVRATLLSPELSSSLPVVDVNIVVIAEVSRRNKFSRLVKSNCCHLPRAFWQAVLSLQLGSDRIPDKH